MIDHTSPIFDTMYLYGCYVPYGSTIPKDELETFGVRTTGVEELDERLMDTPTKVYITINNMIELYRDYYPVSIINTEQAQLVYESIIAYTGKWRTYLSTASMNRSTIPVDDLILMEEFASKVRPHALEGIASVPIQRSLTNILGSVLRSTTDTDLEHDTELMELFKGYKQRKGGIG